MYWMNFYDATGAMHTLANVATCSSRTRSSLSLDSRCRRSPSLMPKIRGTIAVAVS